MVTVAVLGVTVAYILKWNWKDAYAKRQVAFMREQVLETVSPDKDYGTLGLLAVPWPSIHLSL
eukprot:3132587-Amphidinium_carterae.1